LPLLLAILLAPSLAAADAANGARLALQWCASCHVLPGTTASEVPQGPPPFAAVARMEKSPDQLRAFLTKRHGAMPDLSLSRDEIEDLTAYIQSAR
jgi:mono/diheme cytochrome c family protein